MSSEEDNEEFKFQKQRFQHLQKLFDQLQKDSGKEGKFKIYAICKHNNL